MFFGGDNKLLVLEDLIFSLILGGYDTGVYAFADEGPPIVVEMLDEKFSITGDSPEAAKYASSVMFSKHNSSLVNKQLTNKSTHPLRG